MRAVAFVDDTFTVTDVPDLPALGPGQIRIDVHACGICGSDLTVSKAPCRFIEVIDAARYPLAKFDETRPIVLGHEYAGVVAETADDVTDFAIGDRVSGLGIVTDTATGIPKIIGYSNSYHGGFGDQIVVDAVWVRHVPDGLPLEHAALAEPLHVGELHMQRSGLTAIDSALVIGCGTIGLGAVVAAKARGARRVIVSEPSPKRCEIALRLGADAVVDPTVDDPIAVYEQAAAHDVDGTLIAYECSGRQGMIADLLRTLPYDSRIQVLAAPFADETIVPVIGQLRRIAINFGHGPTERAYETVLERLADGTIDADAIITGRIGLDEVADAFATLRDPSEHVKIMVFPRGVHRRREREG